MVGPLLLNVSFEMGEQQPHAATCWQRLRVLHVVLEDHSATAPGYLIVRVHRDRERAIRLCRRGDHEAGIKILERSIDELTERDR